MFLRIIGNSQYKPAVSPLEIFIVMGTDTFQGGPIGRIYATDRDPNDVLSFTQRSQPKSMFRISRQDGSILALPGLEPGRYSLHRLKTDCKYDVEHMEHFVSNYILVHYRVNTCLSSLSSDTR